MKIHIMNLISEKKWVSLMKKMGILPKKRKNKAPLTPYGSPLTPLLSHVQPNPVHHPTAHS